MAKIQLDVPNDLHLGVKQIQLEKEGKGEKINLKELYYEVIKKGLECINNQNPTK
jgi:hypothetical protein